MSDVHINLAFIFIYLFILINKLILYKNLAHRFFHLYLFSDVFTWERKKMTPSSSTTSKITSKKHVSL